MARTRTFFEDTTETCTYSVTVYPAIHTHGFLAIGWHVGVNLRTLQWCLCHMSVLFKTCLTMLTSFGIKYYVKKQCINVVDRTICAKCQKYWYLRLESGMVIFTV